MIRFLGILWVVSTATFLICEPAMAQAPKGKAAKTPAAGKKTPPPKKPPTPKPEPEEADAQPEKREDPYLHVQPDPLNKKEVGMLRQAVLAALKAGKYEAEQQESLQKYYRKWILPNWTLEENYYLLTKSRGDLRKELLQGKSGPPHADALALLLGAMQRLASENFHPAVRYNAMLAIGEMNEEEPVGINGEPTPLADAVPVMIAALTDEKQIDAVKVAALVGLTRHARTRSGIADQQLVTQKLAPALVKLAAEKAPPATRSADGHEWLRCMAIDLLGLLRNVGNNNVVAKTLGTIVADKKDMPEKKDREMAVRSAAARALGNLSYANVSGLDSKALADGLAGLAAEACGRETTSGSSEDEVAVVRRRLRAELNNVVIGINGADEQHKGIRGLAQDSPSKDHVERLYQAVVALTALFDKKDRTDPKQDISDPELAKELGLGATNINQLIMQQAAGAAAPAENGAKPADDKAKAAPKDETAKPPAATPAKPEAKGF